MTCSKCGFESPLESLFKPGRTSFKWHRFWWRIERENICPACHRKDANASQLAVLLLLLLTAVLGIFMMASPRSSNDRDPQPFDALTTNLVLLLAAQYVTIVPHELGHVLGAWIARIRVLKVSFGRGRFLRRWMIGSVPVEFHLLPIAGFVKALMPARGRGRWRVVMLIAGGPLANLALLLAAVWLGGGWSRFVNVGKWIHFLAPWQDLAAANLLMLLGALRPRTLTLEFGPSPSDGRLLFHLCFKPLPPVDELRKARVLARAAHLIELHEFSAANRLLARAAKVFAGNDGITLYLALAQMGLGQNREAIDTLAPLLAKHAEANAFRAVLLNCAAWARLMIATPDCIADAGTESAEAFRLMPWNPHIQGTRAHFLVESGQIEQAIPLLRRALRGGILPDTRATVLCTLAIACWRKGDTAKAAKLLAKARRLDRNCELLARAESELKSPQSLVLKGSQPVGA